MRRPVLTATLAILVVPPVVDVVVSGTRRLFAYTAADTFYYLRTADVWGDSGRLSFDGEHPTNGFHPLWQLLLAGVARVVHWLGVSRTALVVVAVVGSLAVMAGAVVVLARAVERAYGSLPPLFALLPVGLYALTLVPLWLRFGGQRQDSLPSVTDTPLTGTLWNFVNGMETGLVLLAFATLVLVVVRHGVVGRSAVVAQAVGASFLVLARLDTGLVVAGWLATLMVVAVLARDGRLARSVLAVGGAVAAVLVVYMVWNRWYAGAWLPVSGTSKSSFPDPSRGNLRDIKALLSFEDVSLGRSRLQREWPLVVPAVAAGLWLLVTAVGLRARAVGVRARDTAIDRYRLALTGTAVGMLLLTAYDVFFVYIWNQGSWYLPVSILFVSLAGLDAVARTTLGERLARRAGTVVTSCGVTAALVFVTLGRTEGHNERFADFHFDEAPRVRAFYGDDPPRILAWDDGPDAFSLGFPALNGRVLALDVEGVEAYEQGRLLHLAVERGYDRFSSVQYFDAAALDETTPSDAIRARLAEFFSEDELAPYDFAVEYVGGHDLAPPWPGASGTYVTIAIRPRR